MTKVSPPISKKLSAYLPRATFAAFLIGATAAGQTTVPLGTADTYAVLGASTVTNTGLSAVTGDLGVSPGSAVTGFPPGVVVGVIQTPAAAAIAQSDLTAAYNNAAGQASLASLAANLGGQTLFPGVYNAAGGTFGISGILTLDGQGNPNAVFILQAATTLITSAGAPGVPASQVLLIGGAQPCNVFWQVGSSATLGTYSIFQGNILALTSITLTTGASLTGRALARNGAVTLDTNAVTAPFCSGSPSMGSIEVAKNTIGGDGTFAFNSNFGLTSLTTNGGLASRTFNNLVPGGNYRVSEFAPPGWAQTGASCSNGTPDAIAVTAGLTTVCTFTNTQLGPPIIPPPAGSIQVVKNTVGGDGTFGFANNFGMSTLTTNGGAASRIINDILPGSNYSISEIVPPGWILTSASCTSGTPAAIVVVAEGTTTCTFNNSLLNPPPTGSIRVIKNTVGGNGTFVFVSTFGLTSLTTIGGTASQTFNNLTPGGGYRLSEIATLGWNQISAGCTNGTSSAILVVAGVTTTCTIVNTQGAAAGAPDLIIRKSHAGDFRQGDTGDIYTLTVTNGGQGPTTSPVTVSDTLPAGLTATAIGGQSWSCTLAPLSCTRADTLAAGAGYPAVTVTVSVSNNGAVFGPAASGSGFGTGDLLISMADGTVQWRRHDWTLVKVLSSGSDGQAKGMAFDSSGNLFVTHWIGSNSSSNSVAKFDRNGNFTGFFGGGYDCNPSSIAIDNSGNVYVGQADCGAQILKFDSSGNRLAQYSVAVENRGSYHIALDPNQCTMYYTSAGPNVKRFDVCRNTQMPNFNSAPLSNQAQGAQESTLLPGGGMLVANFSVIAQLDASGNLVATYKTPAGDQCWLGSEPDPDGVSFWASNWCASSVTRFNIATGDAIESHVADNRAFMVKQIIIPGNTFSIAVTNTATVAGGGELNIGNNSANDVTNILPPLLRVSNSTRIVNTASYASTVAAGSIATVFGSNLIAGEGSADAIPLPTTLAGMSLQIGGRGAPLFYASPTQVNLQIPWELAGQDQASVTAMVGAMNQQTVNLAPFAPGIFALNGAGTGQGVVLVSGTRLLAAPSSAASGRPAVRGEYISIYCTGLGAVSNQPATGLAAAQSDPLSVTTSTPTVTIGGIVSPVSFSGLASGAVGLYQVNVQIPPGAAAGDAVPVTLTIGGVTSNTVTIAVQ